MSVTRLMMTTAKASYLPIRKTFHWKRILQ